MQGARFQLRIAEAWPLAVLVHLIMLVNPEVLPLTYPVREFVYS